MLAGMWTAADVVVVYADPLIAILDDPASDFADREHYQKDWLGVCFHSYNENFRTRLHL